MVLSYLGIAVPTPCEWVLGQIGCRGIIKIYKPEWFRRINQI